MDFFPAITSGHNLMGVYVWIAVGAAVGAVFRVLGGRYRNSHWLESILMGIGGAAVGGWVGARIRGVAGIDDVSQLAMLTAALGAGILDTIYLFSRRRPITLRRARIETANDPEGRAA